jgi:hypothetical protein
MHGSIDNKKKNSRICNSSGFEKETNNKPVAGSKKTLKDMQLCRIGGPLVWIDIKKNFWHEATLRD